MRGSSAFSFSPVSTHTTLEDAKLALHAYDAFDYVTAYNYGTFSNGSVYRCISHEVCERRLRIVESVNDEDDIPVTFQLAAYGQHGSRATNRKRVGIDLSVKGEVDGLLSRGISLKKCRLTLQNKYADQPEMLAKIPDEKKLKNRLITLKKNGWKSPQATNVYLSSRQRHVRATEWDESSDSATEVSSDAEDTLSRERQEEIVVAGLNSDKGARLSKKRLMDEFTAFPGRPVFWSILKRTKSMENNSNELVTEWTTGQVIGWRIGENLPTKWIVRFSDGVEQPFEIEELIDEIEAAARLGLNVTGRPREI